MGPLQKLKEMGVWFNQTNVAREPGDLGFHPPQPLSIGVPPSLLALKLHTRPPSPPRLPPALRR